MDDLVWCSDCKKYLTAECPEINRNQIIRVCKDFEEKNET